MELVYWIILVVWISLVLVLKKDSSFSLVPALALFLFSAILTVVGIRNLAEPIMRISFIGWIVGISHALIEYIRQLK